MNIRYLIRLQVTLVLVIALIYPATSYPLDSPLQHLSNSSPLSQRCETYDVCEYGLICLNETCSLCETSAQCKAQVHEAWECFLPPGEGGGHCAHKALWPLDWRDFLSFILNFLFSALSAASGMGFSALSSVLIR
jgi:hypothetical protein